MKQKSIQYSSVLHFLNKARLSRCNNTMNKRLRGKTTKFLISQYVFGDNSSSVSHQTNYEICT